jgi:hypothetical protein
LRNLARRPLRPARLALRQLDPERAVFVDSAEQRLVQPFAELGVERGWTNLAALLRGE